MIPAARGTVRGLRCTDPNQYHDQQYEVLSFMMLLVLIEIVFKERTWQEPLVPLVQI